MNLKNLLYEVIVFYPQDYIINESGNYIRVLDQEYIACVVVFCLILFMIFYGVLNLVRLLGGKRR
jgi:hypothetical protein